MGWCAFFVGRYGGEAFGASSCHATSAGGGRLSVVDHIFFTPAVATRKLGGAQQARHGGGRRARANSRLVGASEPTGSGGEDGGGEDGGGGGGGLVNGLELVAVRAATSAEEVPALRAGLPNADRPSDHLPVAAVFKLR
jgi:hypothetical protein